LQLKLYPKSKSNNERPDHGPFLSYDLHGGKGIQKLLLTKNYSFAIEIDKREKGRGNQLAKFIEKGEAMVELKKIIITLILFFAFALLLVGEKKACPQQNIFFEKALTRLNTEIAKIEKEREIRLMEKSDRERQALADLMALSNRINGERSELQQKSYKLKSEITTKISTSQYDEPPDPETESKKNELVACQARIDQLTSMEIAANENFNLLANEKKVAYENLLGIQKGRNDIGEMIKIYQSCAKENGPQKIEMLHSLAERITSAANQNSIESQVTFKSIKATSQKATRGAIVKFQTIRQRERSEQAMSLNEPIETVQAIPIGYYYIWTERVNRPTSDQNRRFIITEESQAVTLVENI
jgi:hypothetical protein